MKLTYFEMRKSWLKVPIFLLLVIFVIIDIYKICSEFKINDTAAGSENLIRNSTQELYQMLKGQVTPEKIDFIKTTSDSLSEETAGFTFSTEYDDSRYTGYVFGDYRLFDGTLKSDFRYIVMYVNSSSRIVQRAYDNIEFYEAHNNNYERLKSIKIANAYQNRGLDSYYLTQGSETFFSYDFSCLLVLCMIVAVFCQSFSKEHEQGMERLIKISAGAEFTVIAKCLSACIFCAFLSLIFTSVDLLAINALYHLDGLAEPIYSLSSFEFSPFNRSVFVMMVNVMLMRFVVYFLISLSVMIISALYKSSLVSLVLSFLFVGGLVILQEYTSTFLNPIEMLSPQKYLAEFRCVNIVGFPIYTIHASIFIYMFMSICIIAALYFLNRRRYHAAV